MHHFGASLFVLVSFARHGVAFCMQHGSAALSAAVALVAPGRGQTSPTAWGPSFTGFGLSRCAVLPVGAASWAEPLTAAHDPSASTLTLVGVGAAPAELGWACEWIEAARRNDGTREAAVLAVTLPQTGAQALTRLLCAGADAALHLPDCERERSALLQAQIRRLMGRHHRHARAENEEPDAVWIDRRTHAAYAHGSELPLKPQWFRLLQWFVEHPGQVFNAQTLCTIVDARVTSADLVHTYVSRVRKLLRPHRLDSCIETVHGIGYRYTPRPLRSN